MPVTGEARHGGKLRPRKSAALVLCNRDVFTMPRKLNRVYRGKMPGFIVNSALLHNTSANAQAFV